MKAHKPQNVWLQRVENDLGYGMPDVYACFKCGHQVWIELKELKRPLRSTSCPFRKGDIRLGQINWHLKASTFRLPSVVAARMDKDIIFLPGKLAVNAHHYSMTEIRESDWLVDWAEFWRRLEQYGN